MEVKGFEKKEKSTAELTVWVAPDEFEAAVNKAYLKEKGKISLPGFRKGKAPRKMIESMYGEGVFYEEAIDSLCPTALNYAAEEKELNIVGHAGVKDFNVGEDKSLNVVFVVALYPEITISGYKGLTAPKAAVRVLKKDIDAEIERVREQNSRVISVDRKAKKNDIVNIDFEGFVDGVAFDGGKGENFDLTLGSGQFIPGFEDQLIGKKAEDEVDVNVTFPEDYHAELAGKAATFKVKIHEVKEKQLPELDDEFAKDVSEFDTLEEYTASVKEKLSEQKKAAAEHDFEEAIMEKVADLVEGDIPDAMIEEHVEQTIDNYNRKLAMQGFSFEQYLGMMGMSIEDYKNTMRPSAEKQIKVELAFEKIAEIEKFEISEERLEKEYKDLSERYEIAIEDIKAAINVERVTKELCLDEAHNLVMSTAVVEKKAAKDKKEEA